MCQRINRNRNDADCTLHITSGVDSSYGQNNTVECARATFVAQGTSKTALSHAPRVQ